MNNTKTHLTPLVIFEDANLIVLSKPAGLLSQGEIKGDANIVDWLRERLGRPYVGLVHRLDRNTSGVMVVAKRTKAAQRLTEQLRNGDLKRTYLALVHQKISKPMHLVHYLMKNEKTNKTEAFKQERPDSRKSGLFLHPIKTIRVEEHDLTWVRIELETGRSHQIRAQLSAERHPIACDTKYGGTRVGTLKRPALHSHTIEFKHPISGQVLQYEAPLPQDLADFY